MSRDFYLGVSRPFVAGSHWGADVPCGTGTVFSLPCKSDVVKSGWNVFYGNYVTVQCVHGIRMGGAHLSKRLVKTGQRGIPANVALGLTGSTGSYSTGPHLHVYRTTGSTPYTGVRSDPMPHILAQFTSKPAGENITPIEPVFGDDDMLHTVHPQGGTSYLIGPDFVSRATDPGRRGLWRSAYGDAKKLSLDALKEAISVAEVARASKLAEIRESLTGVAETVDYARIKRIVDGALETVPEDVVDELKKRL